MFASSVDCFDLMDVISLVLALVCACSAVVCVCKFTMAVSSVDCFDLMVEMSLVLELTFDCRSEMFPSSDDCFEATVLSRF